MARPHVSCAQFVEQATAWMDGALDADNRTLVEEHLAICPHCIDYVAQIRRSLEVLREAPRAAPPHAARAALLDAFRRERR